MFLGREADALNRNAGISSRFQALDRRWAAHLHVHFAFPPDLPGAARRDEIWRFLAPRHPRAALADSADGFSANTRLLIAPAYLLMPSCQQSSGGARR